MKSRPDPSTWFWASLALAALLMALRLELVRQSPPPSGAALVPIAGAAPAAPAVVRDTAAWRFVGPNPAAPAAPERHRIVQDTLRRGDSIYLSLKRHRIDERQLSLLDLALRAVFDAHSQSLPGDYYQLAVDTAGAVQRFVYTPRKEPEYPVLVERVDGRLRGRRQQLPVERRQYLAEVHLVDNLTNAIRQAGEGDGLTDILTEYIFGSVIDFRLDPRRGDRLGLLYEKEYLDGRFIRYGRILWADYQGQRIRQTAFYYRPPGGRAAYYDQDGNSLERMFLIYPLRFRGINSPFNRRRFHPVLKRNRPHLGTDYAASRGEPVHATAIGTVVHAGRKGGYGLMVEIAHPKGYRTRYAHLSQILVGKGQRVAQKERIGRVGATGLATGPHLHYEIIENGRHINPTTVNRGARGKPLAPEHRRRFAAYRDSLLEQIQQRWQRTALAAGE